MVRVAPEKEHGAMLAGFQARGYRAPGVPTIEVAGASARLELTGAGITFGFVLAAAAVIPWVPTVRTPTPPPRGAGAGDAGRDPAAPPMAQLVRARRARGPTKIGSEELETLVSKSFPDEAVDAEPDLRGPDASTLQVGQTV